MKPQHELEDLYYRASTDETLHRCRDCWTKLARHETPYVLTFDPAIDNGFVNSSHPAYHLPNCPAAKSF